MTMEKDAARTRPLFEEPTPEIERPDPWSGPKGFMLGGMALPTKVDLASQFFLSATLLVERIRNNDCEDYRLVNPVLYLYRHALELLLKGGLNSKSNTHRLEDLAGELSAKIHARDGREVPAWVLNRITEIAHQDPSSTAFRYAEVKEPGSKHFSPVDGEIYVDLEHLKIAMAALFKALATLLQVDIDGVSDYGW